MSENFVYFSANQNFDKFFYLPICRCNLNIPIEVFIFDFTKKEKENICLDEQKNLSKTKDYRTETQQSF